MPGKFVTRAAERAGVSLETAEHRWKEAKAKVHKGKRRGSWYWGKVMNTFKRMMGLMESVTLHEWLLFESDSPFAAWPEQFHLYDKYVAVKAVDEECYVSYDVEALMGESTKIQLSGGCSKLAANPDEVSYTLGYDRDFTQKLGIRSDAKFANFKEWAVDAVKKFIEREGLTEEEAEPPASSAPKDIMLEKGYFLEKNPEESTEFRLVYAVKRMMDDEFSTPWYIVAHRGKTGVGMLIARRGGESPSAAMNHEIENVPRVAVFDGKVIKRFALEVLQKHLVLAEAAPRQRPFHEVVDHIHTDFYIGKGLHAEQHSARPNHQEWRLHRVMADEPIGKLFLFRRGTKLWQAVHRMDDTMVKVENVAEFSEDAIKRFILDNPPVNLSEAKQESWLEVTVEAPTGWPPQFVDFWHTLDDIFGGEDNWQAVTISPEFRKRWKTGEPLVIRHKASSPFDYKKLKDAGYRISFLPD